MICLYAGFYGLSEVIILMGLQNSTFYLINGPSQSSRNAYENLCIFDGASLFQDEIVSAWNNSRKHI